MDRVLIQHTTDGREFDIPLSAFTEKARVRLDDGTLGSYADAGFAIVRYTDGRPYEPPASPRADKGVI